MQKIGAEIWKLSRAVYIIKVGKAFSNAFPTRTVCMPVALLHLAPCRRVLSHQVTDEEVIALVLSEVFAH